MPGVRAGVIALVLVFPGVALAAGAAPHFAKGTPYNSVRSQLMSMGFRPVPQKPPEGNFFCGAFDGEADLCKTYPEVIDCGGTGIRPCQFAFQRTADRKQLIVSTYGEQTSRLRILQTEWKTAP